MDFIGKTVLVTGGGRGIGAAIARGFASEGAMVAINYRRDHAAATRCLAACQEAGGDAMTVAADVTDATQVTQLIDTVLDACGVIDVVVHNAFSPFSFNPEQRTPFEDLDWPAYQHQLDGSVRAAHMLARAVLPSMLARADGCFITVASNLVSRPVVPYHDYTTAKAALIGLTRTMASELGPRGIRVNCVCPGLVYPTDASRDTRPSLRDAISAETPLRRLTSPDDVAGAVLCLASPWARAITGQTLQVDGGYTMH